MSDPADRNGEADPRDRSDDDVDALAILRDASAVDPTGLPGPDGPHGRALYEEIVHMPADTDQRPATPSAARPRRLLLGGLALAVLAALAVVAVTSLGGDEEPAPVATDDGSGEISGGFASCAFLYDLDTLADRTTAFEGTIASVDGDDITFDVGEVFTGDVTDPATLGGGLLLVGGGTVSTGESSLAVGDRVLVAGDDGFAWSCGFTQPYDEAVAAQWRDVFAG